MEKSQPTPKNRLIQENHSIPKGWDEIIEYRKSELLQTKRAMKGESFIEKEERW